MSMLLQEHSGLEKAGCEASDTDVETRAGSTASDDETASTRSWNAQEAPEPATEPVRTNAMFFVMMQTLARVAPGPEPAKPSTRRKAAERDPARSVPPAAGETSRLSADAPAFVPRPQPGVGPQWGYDWAPPTLSCFGPEDQVGMWQPAWLPALWADHTKQAETSLSHAAALPVQVTAPAWEPTPAGAAASCPGRALSSARLEANDSQPTSKQVKTLVSGAETRARWADLLEDSEDELEVIV